MTKPNCLKWRKFAKSDHTASFKRIIIHSQCTLSPMLVLCFTLSLSHTHSHIEPFSLPLSNVLTIEHLSIYFSFFLSLSLSHLHILTIEPFSLPLSNVLTIECLSLYHSLILSLSHTHSHNRTFLSTYHHIML